MKASIGSSGGDFPILDEASYVARIYQVVDIGIHQTNFGEKQQIIVTWELPTELNDEGLPHAISKFYTLSLNDKANLRKDLEKMKGKIPQEKLSSQEFIDSLFEKMLGTTCQLSISVYENKEGYKRNGIEGVAKLMKGTAIPESVNEPVLLDLEHFDQAQYDKLPEWLQGKVDEGRTRFNEVHGHKDAKNDDIPFNTDVDDDVEW